MNRLPRLTLLIAMCLPATLIADQAQAGETTPPESGQKAPAAGPPTQPGDGFNGDRLGQLIGKIDAEASRQGNVWQFQYQQQEMLAIFDEQADRMRIVTPIAPASLLDSKLMKRLLQANYDAALDARYAVGNDIIWGVFVHPLSVLDEGQLASAVFQVLSVAKTFGSTFSSGMFTFGGGDSAEENRKLMEDLRERMNPTT